MAGLAQGLEEACARLQATHGTGSTGGGCCHDDHAQPHTHPPQVAQKQTRRRGKEGQRADGLCVMVRRCHLGGGRCIGWTC